MDLKKSMRKSLESTSKRREVSTWSCIIGGAVHMMYQGYRSFFLLEAEHTVSLHYSFIGKILKAASRGIPDYAVVPIDGFPVDRTVNEIVTNAWLVSQ